ncbi:MAG: CsgG/HfaB family protein, partial [Spirochaetota bacterium]
MKRTILLLTAVLCVFALSCSSVNNKVFIKDKDALQKEIRIAVLPFNDVNGAQGQGTGEAIADALTNEIVKISNWTVVERSQLQKVMGEKELNMTGMTSADFAALGKLTKTDYIIIGSVSEFEYNREFYNVFVPKTKLTFKARIIDTENGSIVGTISYNKETGKY